MDQMKRIRLVSNSFYNTGLELARIRDLTGAVQYLQKCLNLNKYHIEARNLLGLIYYEIGRDLGGACTVGYQHEFPGE